MTNLSRYCTLNGTDLTDYIAFSSPPRPIQPKLFVKNSPIIGTNRNVLWSEGIDNFGYEVDIQLDPSQYSTYDTITALFQNLADGDLFYPRSDRYMVCKYGMCVPVQSKSYGPGQGLRLKGALWSEAAELYDADPGTWIELETEAGVDVWTETGETILFETQDIYNYGNIVAPVYAASVIGGTNITLTVGSSSLVLASSLMSDELLEVDRFGQIAQTYSDAFASGTKFDTDGYCYAKYVGSEIALTAVESGSGGEDVTITITDTDQAVTTVSVAGDDITVDLETDAGTPVATAQEVIDAINADDDAKLLVLASLASGEDGTTVMATLVETALVLNVDVAGGALVIEDNYEAGYHLPGSHPLVAGGLIVTFTPTMTGYGVASFEASVDSGATWETVINSNDEEWTDTEEMEVYLPDTITAGQTEVWIRWACDADITSISIDDLEIYQERCVSDSLLPKAPCQELVAATITGATGATSITWRNRYYP